MKLKTKVFLKKKYAIVMGAVAFLLRLPPLRTMFSLFLKRSASADFYLSAYNLVCQVQSLENLIKIADAVHSRFPENQLVRDRLYGLILENGETDRAYDLAKASCGEHLSDVARDLDAGYEDKVAMPTGGKIVQISGYFYSGSGAVLDHLKGYSNIKKWTPQGEVHVIKYPGGLSELYNSLEENGRLTKKELVRFYLHVRAGLYVDSGSSKYKRENVVNKFSRKLLESPSASLYIYELLRLWGDLDAFAMQDRQDMDDFVSIVRKGLSRAFNAVLYQNGAEILVCDQMVTAWRLPSARLLPPCRFIVVHRDPRDQFVEAKLVKNVPGRKKQDAVKYSEVYRKRRELTEEWIPRLESECGHEFLAMAFEDFVIHNGESIDKIREHLSLDKKSFDKCKTKFDPNVSIHNIGKYKNSLTADETGYMEQQLSKYIYER